ncbi:hypothetical protein K435DRAFT_700330, partial [Dendrothele bispora CBS 962.96]
IVWDILTNIDGEIELYFERKFGIPTIAYMICRVASLFYALAQTLYNMIEISDCGQIKFIVPLSFFISNGSTSFLFLLRVRAIFHENQKIRIFFIISWLITIACPGLGIFAEGDQSPIDPRMCSFKDIRPVFGIIFISITLAFDTMVYLAISFRLFVISQFERRLAGPGQRNAPFFTGKCLPSFSRSFLRDGQVYYVISLILGILVITSYIQLLPNQYSRPLISLYNALLSILACYVFRNVKLGRIREESLSISSLHFRSQTGHTDDP